ncbi:transmembrane and coiled-coil domain-containing protein 3-like isoform X1 [Limulus polyphemus]|uniref:Transmembrane and coiled-coil domain-containing protein 3-like isoform X1 n=2 Tax=Limulus polyphemus TaxID=6850 RepID=A0ABM1THT2_LIMPO|nr:transmembrane and coiled-coil domain-containing protein 3-like isoform X1 [Limulus polyphemus]
MAEKLHDTMNSVQQQILVLCFLMIVVFTNLATTVTEEQKTFDKRNDGASRSVQYHEKKKPSVSPSELNKVYQLLKLKQKVLSRIKEKDKIQETEGKNFSTEKQQKQYLFNLYMDELVSAEEGIHLAILRLNNILKLDFQNLTKVRNNCETHLRLLQEALIKQQIMLNEVSKVENTHRDIQEKNTSLHVHGYADELLHNIAVAADKLESQMEDNIFENILQGSEVKASNLEAVVRVGEDDTKWNLKKNEETQKQHEKKSGKDDLLVAPEKHEEQEGMIWLIDPKNNRFVLARGSDLTIPLEDRLLIRDIVFTVVTSFLFSWPCHYLGIPSIIGYICCGLILGPSGINILKSLVQLETLGEFGVLFILFVVGLEFSVDKIKKLWRVIFVSTIIISLISICLGVLVAVLVDLPVKQCGFLGACVSLSSTPLVIKFLHAGKDKVEGPGQVEMGYGPPLMGILIVQDMLLGLLIALLPILASHRKEDLSVLAYFLATLKVIAAICVVLILSTFLGLLLVRPALLHISKYMNKETLLLGAVSSAFIMLMVTDTFKISMELGCFISGVVLTSLSHPLVEEIITIVQPVRDIFACLFFATVGLHIFPSFLIYTASIICYFTIAVVLVKFCSSFLVLRILLRRRGWAIICLVSVGLAQVSEFSFVLGSRARRLGLISREEYLLLISVTTLSLLLSPVMWKLTIWLVETWNKQK